MSQEQTSTVTAGPPPAGGTATLDPAPGGRTAESSAPDDRTTEVPAVAGAVAEVRRRAALSPSRAKDFRQCPLLFRFRAVDRLPEPPSPAATKGTLVHSVLERLFDLPAAARTEDAAHALLDPQWEELRGRRPEVTEMFTGAEDLTAWLAQARSLLSMYFRMENPRRLEPAERESLVETELGSGVLLRGFVDRLDVAPDGAVRVVDYKTGRSPRPRFQDEALFQMRFYALILWRLHGVVPRRLQVVYLGDGRTLSHDPVQAELEQVEAEIEALWEEIATAARREEFPARTSRLCGWCSFQDRCPAFGGTPPAAPAEGLVHLLGARTAPA